MPNTAKDISPLQRKVRKLKSNPKLFLTDSKAVMQTRNTLLQTWAKFGSFALVLAASALMIVYFTFIASSRFVSEAQFVIKEAGSNQVMLGGLAALGGSSPTMRDALILKTFIESREMAMLLNKQVNLKEHYQGTQWDVFSRLSGNSSTEDYVAYYQQHVTVMHDEMSDALKVEIQTFDAQYSLQVAQALLRISETFINNLSDKMVSQQLSYAQQEVERAYAKMSEQQAKLINFQDTNAMYSPEVQGNVLVEAINTLQVEIIKEEAELTSLLAVMRDDSVDVRSKQTHISSLKQQVELEQAKLTSKDQASLNKVSREFKELTLKNELAADLYASTLINLEKVRTEAYQDVKHLLVIEYPALAQDQKYPRRLYSIITWFMALLLIYAVGKMVVTIIKEHKE